MSGYALYWTNTDGTLIALNDMINWYLVPNGLYGFDVPKLDNANMRRPYRDGGVLLGRSYAAPREFAVALDHQRTTWALWGAALRTLRSRLTPYKSETELGTFKLIDSDNAVTRSIDCRCTGVALVNDGPTFGVITVNFWAPDPWWYDPTEQSAVYALAAGAGIVYPVVYVTATGVAYGTSDVDSVQGVVNAGDVETWPTITILGPCQAPKIENQTADKLMEFLGGAAGFRLYEGDSVAIDMDAATVEFHDRYVTALGVNYDTTVGVHYDTEFGIRYGDDSDQGINIIEKLSDASEFWPLVPGENLIRVQMRNATTGTMTVEWYNRYLSGL